MCLTLFSQNAMHREHESYSQVQNIQKNCICLWNSFRMSLVKQSFNPFVHNRKNEETSQYSNLGICRHYFKIVAPIARFVVTKKNKSLSWLLLFLHICSFTSQTTYRKCIDIGFYLDVIASDGVFAAIMPPVCWHFFSFFRRVGDIAAVTSFWLGITLWKLNWMNVFRPLIMVYMIRHECCISFLFFSLCTLIGSGIPKSLFDWCLCIYCLISS